MAGSFLETIRPHILASIARLKEERPPAEWESRALQRPGASFDFVAALSQARINIIAEIKKASPSRGIIRQDCRPVDLARVYETHGAAALSLLTEEKYFLGDIRSLAKIATISRLPILRKDFILDEVQLAQARSNGAAAALLIVAFLSQEELIKLMSACRKYSLAPLVEVHDKEELKRATDAGAGIIGVNNRNLLTLAVNTETARKLIVHKRSKQLWVAESGLNSPEQLRELRAMGYDAFLIGEHLMRAADPGAELERLRGIQ